MPELLHMLPLDDAGIPDYIRSASHPLLYLPKSRADAGWGGVR